MDPFFSKQNKNNLKIVIDFVCLEYKISEKDLYSKIRSSKLSKARFVAWYILKNKFKILSLHIANEFSKVPSTIKHGLKYIEKTKTHTDIDVKFDTYFSTVLPSLNSKESLK